MTKTNTYTKTVAFRKMVQKLDELNGYLKIVGRCGC